MVQISRKYDYSDLDLDFIPHPTTKDVVKKTGEDAIKRSVRNLILTNFYDRKFQHYIGSNTYKLLFEPINPLIVNFLRDAIFEVLGTYEPRVAINTVKVSVDADNNGYNVTIEYIIKNNDRPVTINLFLERIR